MSPAKSTSKRRPSQGMSGAEYATLVLLLATALVGTAILISWLAEQQGILAPGSVTRPDESADDGTGTDQPTEY